MKHYLDGAERDRLDPILDACVAVYRNELDEDGQVAFKGTAKGFVRTYAFLSSVLPYTNAAWEKRSIFLNFLISKLPAPKEEDLSKGILDAIDMESYRAEKRAMQKIALPDEDAEIAPVPAGEGGHRPEPELDRLSNIIRDFNDRFGNIEWKDTDKIERVITEVLPEKVAADKAYQNAVANSEPAECPNRARQGPGTCRDRVARGPHRAVQAVQRQRVVPEMAFRNRLCSDLPSRGRNRKHPGPVKTVAEQEVLDIGSGPSRKRLEKAGHVRVKSPQIKTAENPG